MAGRLSSNPRGDRRVDPEDTTMEQRHHDIERRTLLRLAAGFAALGEGGLAHAGALAARPVGDPPATGKPGDFDFLTGEWKIANEQRKGDKVERFEGEATVHSILRGIASIEELRIPARRFSGMGLRLLDVERKLWADYWVNSMSGVLSPPPAWGSFVDGVGLWDSEEVDGEQPIIVRGAWDEITPKSCRWYQAVSRDAGKTWEENWVMRWTRVK